MPIERIGEDSAEEHSDASAAGDDQADNSCGFGPFGGSLNIVNPAMALPPTARRGPHRRCRAASSMLVAVRN